ncbi:MAG: hypothetical protein CMO35_11510 [Verrucomicrobiaceae bacterium]|nr:hypothetical protein [Verrucomicrobiaceae bacterium]
MGTGFLRFAIQRQGASSGGAGFPGPGGRAVNWIGDFPLQGSFRAPSFQSCPRGRTTKPRGGAAR